MRAEYSAGSLATPCCVRRWWHFMILAVSFTVLFSYFYIKYDRIIEKRFRSPVFANSAKIYALPKTVRDGEKIETTGNCHGAAASRLFR